MTNVNTQNGENRSARWNGKGPGGFHAVPRKMIHPSDPLHPMQTGEEMSRWGAWIDLTALARFKAGDGLERGEARASERFLAKRWNWTRKRVRCFLEKLEDMGRIKMRPTPDPFAPDRAKILEYDRLFMPGGAHARGPRQGPTTGAHATARRNGDSELSGAQEDSRQGPTAGAHDRGPKRTMHIENQAPPENQAQNENQAGDRHGGEAAAPRPPSGRNVGRNPGGEKEGKTPVHENGNGRPAPGSENDSARRVGELEDGRPIYLQETEDGWCVEVPNRSPTYLPSGIEASEVADDPQLARTLANLPTKIAQNEDGGTWKVGVSHTGTYLLYEGPGGEESYHDLINSHAYRANVLDLLDPPSASLEEDILDYLEGVKPGDLPGGNLDGTELEGLFGYNAERPVTPVWEVVKAQGNLVE